MAKAKPRKQMLRFCSLMMAFIFAISASVQLNDPDWYLWFPLYAAACAVNLVNGASMYINQMRQIARLTLWLGGFLLIKPLIEDFVKGIAGFWSLDMRERVVRERFGSGLAVASMSLQLKASSMSMFEVKVRPHVEYGMAVLVGITYGLSLAFLMVPQTRNEFLIKHRERKAYNQFTQH
ncbi:uncharacterized protein LOC127803444 [Diospyros lotus]|uniref:uncharacterized protein LOC127803444 n=1 Tax=Diospyros lotus TaxID=55363 RepID=UPI002252A6E0|nr:uncharacterized protein LOC127803444 [Diospyros lotus]